MSTEGREGEVGREEEEGESSIYESSVVGN